MEQVIEILKLIQNTSSLNEKQRILRENKDNKLLKKCLVFLLDGNTVTGISTKKINKMTISKAANYATFEPKNFSEVIDYLKTHNTGTDVDVATIRKFICNNSKSEAECQFYEEMVTKKFRLGADAKLVNKAIPGLIEEFNVQLGTSIEKVKLKGNELIYISRKLNGLRCSYIGTECRTRQNKKINGIDHIIKDLQVMGYGNMFLDGELVYKNKEGLSDSEAFQKGTGIANSKSSDKSQLKFKAFDILPLEEFWAGKSKDPYSVRYEKLNKLKEDIKAFGIENIEVVERVYHGYDHSKIWEWLQYAEDNDWEGCCINLDKPYECKRTKNLMADEALKTSALLAKEYGPYPKYNPEAVEQSAYYSKNALGETKQLVKEYGLRNSQLLTIAPTGTLSTMLGVSGGIEPIFANYYTRKTESLKGHDEYYKVYTPIVKDYMKKNNLKDDSELPNYFVTAQTLDYKNRIYMQSVWQTHIDASISSTVNVPNDFTVEQVEGLYMTAWEAGLKGVTIFRDGCKRAGILTTSDSKKDDETSEKPKTTLGRGMIIKADDNCVGKKRTLQTGCGTLHCEAFFDPDTGELLETYLSKGSSGGCNQFMIGLSRMISLAARGGVDIYSIIDQLKSSGTCPSYAVRTATKHDTSKGSCCPVAIGNALIDMYKEMQDEISDDSEDVIDTSKQPKKKIVVDKSKTAKCPQCGGNLVFEGGCNTCKDCGWSKCD